MSDYYGNYSGYSPSQAYYNPVPGYEVSPTYAYPSEYAQYYAVSAAYFPSPETTTSLSTPHPAPVQSARLINEADYAFPDPEIIPDPDERPVKIIELPKDNEEEAGKTNRWQREIKKKAAPVPEPKPVPLITCSKCGEQKEDSTIKCHQNHLLCIECAASTYLQGELECSTCKADWTMLQIVYAHYVLCGEGMPEYHLQRPKEVKQPKESFICIGKDQKIKERIDEREIPFPATGHLSYLKNKAVDACPNKHDLCKSCADDIVTQRNKQCPVCKAALNYQPPPKPCSDQAE